MGLKVDNPKFEMGVDNKTPEFLSKNPLGKVSQQWAHACTSKMFFLLHYGDTQQDNAMGTIPFRLTFCMNCLFNWMEMPVPSRALALALALAFRSPAIS